MGKKLFVYHFIIAYSMQLELSGVYLKDIIISILRGMENNVFLKVILDKKKLNEFGTKRRGIANCDCKISFNQYLYRNDILSSMLKYKERGLWVFSARKKCSKKDQ